MPPPVANVWPLCGWYFWDVYVGRISVTPCIYNATSIAQILSAQCNSLSSCSSCLHYGWIIISARISISMLSSLVYAYSLWKILRKVICIFYHILAINFHIVYCFFVIAFFDFQMRFWFIWTCAYGSGHWPEKCQVQNSIRGCCVNFRNNNLEKNVWLHLFFPFSKCVNTGLSCLYWQTV